MMGLIILRSTRGSSSIEFLTSWINRRSGTPTVEMAQSGSQTFAPTATFSPDAAWLTITLNAPVYSGPGDSFSRIAILESGNKALIVGVSQDRSWWAVSLPYYNEGFGWVSAQLVETNNTSNVEVLDEKGNLAAAPTATRPSATVKAITNINIRSGPATRFMKIGTLESDQTTTVFGVSPDRFWWLVEIPGGQSQQGWLARDYVIASNADDVPVVGLQGLGESGDIKPGTPFLTSNYATVNVRAGPSTTYAVVGQLSQGQTAAIVGKDEDGIWWLIAYPSAPDGVGWVAAAYVTAENTVDVPIKK